jgi:hypothetical protein
LRIAEISLFCVVAVCCFFLGSRAEAKPEYSKKEKATCVTCHVSAKSKELNDTGKYYKEHKALPAKK